MKNPKWVMNCNALSKVIFERERASYLWPYVDFNFIIFMPKIYKITVIFFCVTFYLCCGHEVFETGP